MNCLTDFGDKIVNLKLEDEEPKSTPYSFLIKVINLPPKFQGAFPSKDLTVMMNSVLKFDMPPFYDPEGCPVTLNFKPDSVSTFVSYKDN